jgi:hypothetical protein
MFFGKVKLGNVKVLYFKRIKQKVKIFLDVYEESQGYGS